MMASVAVVGGGVIGLTTAVRIQQQRPDLRVTVITELVSPDTTGDGSAGLWGPYLLGKTPPEHIVKWSKATHDLFRDLWRSGSAADAGLCLQPCTRVIKDSRGYKLPPWHKVVYGLHPLSKKQLQKISDEHGTKYSGAVSFVTFTCEPTKLLPYLTARLVAGGGVLERRRVQRLADLAGRFDAVINCCGLSARELASDPAVYAIRGQVARVEAHGQFYTFLDDSDDGNYIIPNTNTIVLGGTHQIGDEDTKVRREDSAFIFNGCYKTIPALKHNRVVSEWVGLRPGRDSVRLELEQLKVGSKWLPVIHNYGHGGAGVTLSWGCAIDATDLLTKALPPRIRSRL